MTKTARLIGGPLDGHTQEVRSLFIGFETGLFPHLGFSINGEKINYGPTDESDNESIVYRQVWLKEDAS